MGVQPVAQLDRLGQPRAQRLEPQEGVEAAARQLRIALQVGRGVRRPRRVHDDPLDTRIAEQPEDVGGPVHAGLRPGVGDLVRRAPEALGQAYREQLLEQPAGPKGPAAVRRLRSGADVQAQVGQVEGAAGEGEGMGVVVDHLFLLLARRLHR